MRGYITQVILRIEIQSGKHGMQYRSVLGQGHLLQERAEIFEQASSVVLEIPLRPEFTPQPPSQFVHHTNQPEY